MLKVVHEDEHSSANEAMMPYLNKGNNLGSLMSIVSSNSGYQNQMYQMQQRGVKMSSREKNSKA
jgi:hypothetical protein